MSLRQFVQWSTVGYSILTQHSVPFYYALGFPKSGTGWLTRILSDYLNLPKLRVKHRWLPSFRPCVIKTHRFVPGSRIRNRTLYIVRDIRDIAVSFNWHVLRHGGSQQREVERFTKRVLSPDDVTENLPNVLRYLASGRSSSLPWTDHIRLALDKGYQILRYEDLLADPVETLSDVFSKLPGHQPDTNRLKFVIRSHAFEAETGRPAGTDDNSSYIRSGVAGQWKEAFDRESAELCRQLFGETLLAMNYEADDNWVDRFVSLREETEPKRCAG
ncbi:MAG: sulfotransferase domain-containing protein [Planctomycetaceae bacterium]|nr:sulfotransferase domain-containing protein [Planctomycetaceae bacterium]